MKVRISKGSIQYRLSAQDVDDLASGGDIRSDLSFGSDGTLAFALVPASDVEGLDVQMTGTTITVRIPLVWVGTWKDDERVGFEADVAVGNAASIEISVEKDLRWFRKPKDDEQETRA